MTKRIEIVESDSRRRAQSSVNNRVEEYEEDGFELIDQEIAAESSGVIILLVFQTSE